MDHVLARLRKAIAEGAALAALGLAGCAAPVIPSIDSGQHAIDSGSEVQDSGFTADSGMLAPFPNGLVNCHGPDYGEMGFGYHGQCCNQVQCVSCDGGRPTLPPGSGTCSCAVQEGGHEFVRGPFAPEPGDPPGSCCYLVGSIRCDGRPLLVDGEAVTAPVVSRSDWA